MWEEYIVPLICIAFIAGVVIGINLAMLCSQRFSSKQQVTSPYIHAYNNTPGNLTQQTQNFPGANSTPMQYPSGYLQHPNYSRHMHTTSELTANDFAYGNNAPRKTQRRRQSGGLNYG